MNCRKSREQLSEYLDGNLEQNQVLEVEAHLEQCGECAKLLKEMQKTVHLVRAIPFEAAPSNFAQAIQNRIAEANRPLTFGERLHKLFALTAFRPALATAFTLIIALLIGAWIYFPGHQSNTPAPDNAYLQAVMADHTAYAAQQPLMEGSGEVVMSGLDSEGYE